MEVYKEEAFDLLDGKHSLLKSELLKKANANNFDISKDTLEAEMKEQGCANIEALCKKITDKSNLRAACSCPDKIKIGSRCPCTKAEAEIFALIDIKNRYDIVSTNNAAKSKDRQMIEVKEKFQSELEILGFENIDELVASLLDSTKKLPDKRRSALIEFRTRFEKAFYSITSTASSKSYIESNERVYSTYNIRYQYSERNGKKKTLREFNGISIADFGDFDRVMKLIDKNRKAAETSYNDRSSRSHLIITLKISRKSKEETKEVKVNLVDLAGSENASKIGCERIDEVCTVLLQACAGMVE